MLASLQNTNNNVNSSSSSSNAALLNNRQIAASQMSLNVGLVKQQQQQQQRLLGTSANDAGNLSPSVIVNGSASPISINNTTAVRFPSTVTSATVAAAAAPVVAAPVNVTPLATQIKVETSTTTSSVGTQESIEPSPPPLGTSANERKCTYLGDYEFFEPAAPTDSFGTAINIKTGQPYLWKVN